MEASRVDGMVEIRTRETESQLPPTAPDSPQLDQPATTVRVGVSEQGFFVEADGPRIDANLRANILEYGMLTGDGSGFGLAIVRTIVEAHCFSKDRESYLRSWHSPTEH